MLDKKIAAFVVILSLSIAGIGMGTDLGLEAPLDPTLETNVTEVVQVQDSVGRVNEAEAVDQNTGLTASQSETSPQQGVSVKKDVIAAKPANQSTTAAYGSNVSRGGSRTGRVLTMTATGYDSCYECNKPFYGKPSYIGLPLRKGVVAVDPRVIPMGTRLYVEGYGEAIAADQGNAIKGNRIDLFFDSHQQALNYGKKTVKVTIL